MLVMVVCDITAELSTDGYWELFRICLASANNVPLCPPSETGIRDRQKLSRQFECDTV